MKAVIAFFTGIDPVVFGKILLAIALVGGVYWGYEHVKGTGAAEQKEIDDKLLQEAKDKAQLQYQVMVAKYEKQVNALQLDMHLIEVDHAKENDDAKSKIADLNDRIRVGAMRLSIAIAHGAGTPGADGKGTAVAGGGGQAQTAELMPETALALVAIARDGDAAVRRANECADRYEAVEKIINAP